MRLLLICIYVCVCLWCGNVYAVRVLFMHEDAPVGRQTTNIFDDNTRKDDLREATKKMVKPKSMILQCNPYNFTISTSVLKIVYRQILKPFV